MDGDVWTVVSTQDGLVDNEIITIVAGPGESVWFGSYDQGVSRLYENEWNTLRTGDEIPSNAIGKIAVAKTGEIWFSHTDGVTAYDGEGFTTYKQFGTLEDNAAYTLLIESDNTLWVGTWDGLARFKDQEWSVFPVENEEWFRDVNVINIDNQGNYLFGTSYNGIYQWDGFEWTQSAHLQKIRGVDDILAAPNGDLWFASMYNGVYSYDGNILKSYKAASGLLGNDYPFTLAINPEGVVWAGSFHGVSYFDGNHWNSYSENDGLLGEVHDMVVDQQGTVWAGTNLGLYCFDGKRWTGYTTQDGLGDNYIKQLAVGLDGAIWIPGIGLSRFIPPLP